MTKKSFWRRGEDDAQQKPWKPEAVEAGRVAKAYEL